MSDGPAKLDIQQVFKKLRSLPANKVCFDCGSKNPTWASITYGIFICIDCSGIHRSLGVHLTFIRSTNLDTNWTWQQLRQMQLGGNAKALAFFRSQNCNTNDAQVKYSSRAAQLYREKLHQAAAQAMRLHGTKLFIEAGHDREEEEEEKPEEEDFFSKHEVAAPANGDYNASMAMSVPAPAAKPNGTKVEDDGAAPSVELALSTSPGAAEQQRAAATAPRKPTIGGKKAPPKKSGLGAKKGGLGAQRVSKDFAEIEKEAELADQIALTRTEAAKMEMARNPEEEAKAMASMRLAYQDLSLQQKMEEERLKKVDPSKAAQIERLGMGFGGFGGGKVSHSLMSDMGEIVQEEPAGGSTSKPSFTSSTKDKFFDDFEVVDVDSDVKPWRTSRIDEICQPASFDKSAWEKDLNSNQKGKSSASSASKWDNDFEKEKPRKPVSYTATPNSSGEEAVKKFGNAKSISSDMFFGNENQGDRDANLSRFQGSSSISSDMYFNRETGSGGVPRSASYGYNLQAPDMDDVKESVKQGVSKVAGRLSNMASGVMSQIQRVKNANAYAP